jgi:hypothetical protein
MLLGALTAEPSDIPIAGQWLCLVDDVDVCRRLTLLCRSRWHWSHGLVATFGSGRSYKPAGYVAEASRPPRTPGSQHTGLSCGPYAALRTDLRRCLSGEHRQALLNALVIRAPSGPRPGAGRAQRYRNRLRWSGSAAALVSRLRRDSCSRRHRAAACCKAATFCGCVRGSAPAQRHPPRGGCERLGPQHFRDVLHARRTTRCPSLTTELVLG